MPKKKKQPRTIKKSKLPSEKLLESLKQFIRTEGKEYLRDQNISSIGIGYKWKDNKPTKEISIQFTVNVKAKPDRLEALGTKEIPKFITIGRIKILTDVLERKYEQDFKIIREASVIDRKVHCVPIVPGISVANKKETAGTIGCIVFDRTNGTPYILSNWHVLHGAHGYIGDLIVQPGPYDDNRTDINNVGKLIRSYIGVAGDCALASIEDRSFEQEVLDLGVNVEQFADPELGDKVIKSGRTTGVTEGVVTRIHTIVRLNYGDQIGEKEIGCFEIGVDDDHPPENGEISEGGDSGSVWLFKNSKGKASKIMAGLHFAGEGVGGPREHALACYAKSVFEKLEVSPTPPKTLESKQVSGYNNLFLSQKIEFPKLYNTNTQKTFRLQNSELIHYTHFSLTLNKFRRFASCVGWNIDGNSIKKVSRKGINFTFDKRIPSKYQVGKDLYINNELDQGHIARRADLVWGSNEEAKKANKDSFYFTNITPQMSDFNQGKLGGIWGKLEDAVFDEVDVDDLKVSVFGGPVFRDDDRVYRKVKIPREFFKVIVYQESQKLKAKAFLLTQNLNQLELLDLNEFRVFQVTLAEVEQRCGIIFPDNLKEVDELAKDLEKRPESIPERKAVNSLRDIRW